MAVNEVVACVHDKDGALPNLLARSGTKFCCRLNLSNVPD